MELKHTSGLLWMLPVVPFLGYRISTERDVGACILSMRMAFKHVSKLPENFKFIANGYSAYPLAAQQFYREFKEDFKFDFKALERMEDNGIYFGDLNERDYHSLALFFWACSPQYTLDEILGALIGGLLPVTVAELMEQLVDETKKAVALAKKK